MPPDPPREQGPPGLATPTQINATPISKTVENPEKRKERNAWIFRVSLIHVKQAQLINLVIYLKAMYLTSQNDCKTENLSGKWTFWQDMVC